MLSFQEHFRDQAVNKEYSVVHISLGDNVPACTVYLKTASIQKKKKNVHTQIFTDCVFVL